MTLFAGIDIGSVATKLVILDSNPDKDTNIVYSQVVPSSHDPEQTAKDLLGERNWGPWRRPSENSGNRLWKTYYRLFYHNSHGNNLPCKGNLIFISS